MGVKGRVYPPLRVAHKVRRDISELRGYQSRHVAESLPLPEVAYWVDMGLGKTVMTLTAVVERMDMLEVYGTLVVAPLRVCQTVWAQEGNTWEHTKHLAFSLIHGTVADRLQALRRRADVYLMNYENIPWLVDQIINLYLAKGKYPPFNHIVFDEISKMKNSASKRHRKLMSVMPYIQYRTGLTGTPASKGYEDLFGQYLALDGGLRLGKSKARFLKKYFSTFGFKNVLKPGAAEIIENAISDITLHLDKKDHLELPPAIYQDIDVQLDVQAQKAYNTLEKEMFLKFDSGEMTIAVNKGVLYGKCLQAANGAVYCDPERKNWELLHDFKLDALNDIIEESQGKPVLCFYLYKHDWARILEAHPEAVKMGGRMTTESVELLQSRWSEGKIPLLCGHPDSIGHGLNLQYGGHIIVWFGLPWSLDLYLQGNARLAERQGQVNTVTIHRLITRGTLDELVATVLRNRQMTESDLKRAVAKYRSDKATRDHANRR